jgi:hypothetical protein
MFEEVMEWAMKSKSESAKLEQLNPRIAGDYQNVKDLQY